MQDRTLKTDSRAASPKRNRASIADSRSATSERGRTFDSCRLVPLLLILAVAVFAYGYKVSQYRIHSGHTERVPVARAVVEHRFGSATATAHRHRSRSQIDFGPDGHIVQRQASSPVLIPRAARVFAQARALCFPRSALPLRSPPFVTA